MSATELVVSARTDVRYDAFVEEGMVALADEIQVVLDGIRSWGGHLPAPIYSGVHEQIVGDQHVYRVNLVREVKPPEYTALEVVQGSHRVRGYVEEVTHGGRTLTITMDDALKGELRGATIVFDPTEILRKTQETLLELSPKGNHPRLATVQRFLGVLPVRIRPVEPRHESIVRRQLNAGQYDAIAQVTEAQVGFIFGPPGTGKTRTLGPLVAEMVARGKRVLVTAHTNTALDTAMASVLEAMGPSWRDGRVVRLGKLTRDFRHLNIGSHDLAKRQSASRDQQLLPALARTEALAEMVLPAPTVLARGRSTARSRKTAKGEEKSSVSARLSALRNRIDQAPDFLAEGGKLSELRASLSTLQKQYAQSGGSVADRAQVLGATLSSLMMRKNEVGVFDTLVVDEGSMAGILQVAICASFARDQVVVLGDPKQLPPVVMAETPAARRFLKRDPFRYHGLESPARRDPRRPILTVQHRMAPSVREFVSNLFYDGLLEDAPHVKDRITTGPSLILVDTSEAEVTAEIRGGSRINEDHAEISARLVEQLRQVGETDLGIICPFKPQSRLIEQKVKEADPFFADWGGFVRTIHRSQGGEKSTILFDSTDAPPRMGSFLDERFNEDLAQMLCVALSRAQNRLVILAHTKAFRNRYGRRGALIMRILEEAYRQGAYVRVTRDARGSLLVPSITDPALLLTARTVTEAAEEGQEALRLRSGQ